MTWLRRFIRAIVIGGDASELTDLRRARREQEQRRGKEGATRRRRGGRERH